MAEQDTEIPTLYVWAGRMPAFERLTDIFYSRVGDDALLAPVFAHLSPAHARYVAHFIAEVLGGPKIYSEASGGHANMVAHHLGRSLTQEQRKQWVRLLLDCADEAGLPDDPEFRSAFIGYLEWGSRLAVLNSQPGVPAPDPTVPMPVWNWGAVGGPYRPEG